MKRVFFLGVGVGFIIAGVFAAMYEGMGVRKETKKTVQEKIEYQPITEGAREELYTISEETEKVKAEEVPEVTPPVVLESVVVPEEKPKVETKVVKREEPAVKEKKDKKEKEKPIEKKEKIEKNVEKTEPKIDQKRENNEKTEPLKIGEVRSAQPKPVTKESGELTAPLSPTGEKMFSQKEEKKALPEEKAAPKEIKSGGEYYVQVITTSSEDECKRLIKRVKDVNLTYTKRGSKFTVMTGNLSKEDGESILESLEKYNLKGLLVKKAR